MKKGTRFCISVLCKKAACLLLLFALFLSIVMPAYAADEDEGRKVRVGYIDYPGFIEKDADGKYFGYGVEYLSEICTHTGWQIEYVYAPWFEQLDMLERGEVDIVPLAQYSEERTEKFLYTAHPIGILQGLLLTLPESDIESDAAAYNEKTIGVLRDSRSIALLERYAEREGFSYVTKEYDDQSGLEASLLAGETDMIACEHMIWNSNLRILDRFSSDPYYFITSKDNAALMAELDDTISRIIAFDPTYAVELYQKYFNNIMSSSHPYFTNNEDEYIASCGEITVALIPDSGPVIYVDENGEPAGVIPDILDIISEMSGLKFNYTFVPKDMTPLAFLQENPTYIAGGLMYENPAFAKGGVLRTEPYYTAYSGLVINKKDLDSFDLATAKTIGMPTSFQMMHLYIQNNYPHLTIMDYLSASDGLQALQEEKIDCFTYVFNSIAADLSNPRYSDIVVLDRHFVSNGLCTVATDSPDNRLLIGIMDKCIAMIPDNSVGHLEVEHLQKSLYRFEQEDVIYRYRDIILVSSLAILVIIIVLISTQLERQRRYTREITLHAEYDMMTGVYNRKTLEDKVQQFMDKNPGKSCAAILIDVDNMRRLNDTRGHAVGDEVLKALANVLKEQFRGSTIIGRTGGDEFGVFLSGVESRTMLIPILARLQNTISSLTIADGTVMINSSIGVTMSTIGMCPLDELVRQATEALTSAKDSGKNGFAFYNSHNRISISNPVSAIAETDMEKNETQTADEPLAEDARGIVDIPEWNNHSFKRLFDVFPNMGVYVIERDSHKVLFYNRRFREICPNMRIGKSCRGLMFGPCENCIVDTMGEQTMAHTIFYSDAFRDEVEITATQFMWEDRTPAVMISYWPRNILTSSSASLPSTSNQDTFDYITGGMTRAGFIHMMKRMRHGGVDLTEYVVLFVNIKDFKAVNEITGSDGGDNLLRTVFERIEQSALYPVIGARKESDHFIFMVEKKELDLAILPELLNFHWKYKGKDLFIHCRCGIFMIDDNETEVYKMIDRAKLAKDHIVDDFVQPYEVYKQSMMDEYSENAEAFLLFDNGIKNNEFVVYYQPVMDAKTGKVVSAEALVRRKTADGTIISPGRFIPILERTGYISMLDRFVARDVSRFLHERMDSGLPIVPVSFNLSQKDFYDEDLMDTLAYNLEHGTLPKGTIMLELTESAYTMNEKKHGGYLKQLRGSGAKILLDDFGTGYSSFGMFENYNFDRVKLDMSFVRQLSGNENVRIVVESIISMCHKLGIQVVAEGVETEQELSILREMDCDLIQGYYFSKPVDEASFAEYIERHI